MNEKVSGSNRCNDAVDASQCKVDVENGSHDSEGSPTNHEARDIEHVYVRDDPRKWSSSRKV